MSNPLLLWPNYPSVLVPCLPGTERWFIVVMQRWVGCFLCFSRDHSHLGCEAIIASNSNVCNKPPVSPQQGSLCRVNVLHVEFAPSIISTAPLPALLFAFANILSVCKQASITNLMSKIRVCLCNSMHRLDWNSSFRNALYIDYIKISAQSN